MQPFMQWIMFLLVNMLLYDYTVTEGASVLIYVDSSNNSQSNCSSTAWNETLCDINVTEYSNFTSLMCPNLDTALNYISTTTGDFSFAHICLLSRNVILRKSWSINISLVLTSHSVEYQSVIQCHYNDTQNTGITSTADELKYMLFLYKVEYVK